MFQQSYEHGMLVRRQLSSSRRGTILYLHGLGESGLCFEGIPSHFELSDWDHVIVDLPGYGKSLWQDTPAELSGIADHVEAWARDSLDDSVFLVGHSMGGVVALLVAERHPSRVRGLVDIEGNKCEADCSFSGRAASMSESDFLAKGFDGLLDGVYRSGQGQPAMRGYYASMRMCDPRAFYLHAQELCTVSRSEMLAQRLASLSVPSAYLAGTPGGASPRALELLGRAGVPLHEVGPSGHWPFVDQPALFAKTLARILGQMQS